MDKASVTGTLSQPYFKTYFNKHLQQTKLEKQPCLREENLLISLHKVNRTWAWSHFPILSCNCTPGWDWRMFKLS